MKIFKAFAFASFMAFGLSACGGDSAGEWKSKYQKIVDEACACKDEGCFDQARDKRKALRNEFKEAFKDKRDEAEKVGKQMQPLDEKFNECGDKLRESAQPPTEKATEPPTEQEQPPAE